MLLPLALACSPPSPSPPLPAPAEPLAVPFTLIGLADDSHLPLPALPEGPALLGPACFSINERLTALDPKHPGVGPPCGVERWATPTERFDLLWAAEVALISRPGTPDRGALNTWRSLDGVLLACLGPPLNLPPGGDPGAARSTDGTRWTLTFSGQNRCSMAGRLDLWMYADRSDPRALSVHAAPWREGGRGAAESLLLAEP